MSNQSVKSAPKVPAALAGLEKDIIRLVDSNGLVNYVDCCFQEQDQNGTPFERIEAVVNGLSAREAEYLREWLAKFELHAPHKTEPTVATPLRAGTQTGSLMNHLFSGAKMTAPKVGMGVTMLCWSDRHAATITVIKSPKRIGIVQDIAKRTDSDGMTEQQQYEFSPGTGGPIFYTLRKNGAWVREGESMSGGARIAIGARSEYHDFSF